MKFNLKLCVILPILTISACTEADVTSQVTPDKNVLKEYQGWQLYEGKLRELCRKNYPLENPKTKMKDYINQCGAHRPPASQSELSWLKEYALKRMISVKGGTFTMGDFGELHTKKSTPPVKKIIGFTYPPILIDILSKEERISKFLVNHQERVEIPYFKFGTPYWNGIHFTVKLSDYMMSSHMVEEQEYNLFASVKGYPLSRSVGRQSFNSFEQLKEAPAMVTWDRANEYCQWLGEQIGKPLGLPTEAQWEYAARNQGEFRVFATNNGQYEDGVNAAAGDETVFGASPLTKGEISARDLRYLSLFKKIPPNPLGFYNMQGLEEWVNDWYDKDYFEQGKEYVDPQGPENGTIPKYILDSDEHNYETENWRSIRGGGSVWHGVSKLTFFRDGGSPSWERSFRCASK